MESGSDYRSDEEMLNRACFMTRLVAASVKVSERAGQIIKVGFACIFKKYLRFLLTVQLHMTASKSAVKQCINEAKLSKVMALNSAVFEFMPLQVLGYMTGFKSVSAFVLGLEIPISSLEILPLLTLLR